MTDILLKPIAKVNGEITLPGSKSLSNRILLLSALAQGNTTITNLLHSDDTTHMLNALAQLGINFTLADDKTTCQMTGAGGPFPIKEGKLFVGNSGTTVRFLTAALSAMEGRYQLDGIARMHQRPIKDLVDALKQAGGKINYLQNEGYPPLEILPSRLHGGTIKIRGDISSQFVTALLMVVPLCGEETAIEIEGALVSQPYVDMTIKTMAQFGVMVENDAFSRFIIPGNQHYVSPGAVFIEGDASSATYFLSAGAIGGGTVRVNGVGQNSLQGDARFADLLGEMGASVRKGETWLEISRGQLKAIDRDLSDMPDAAMTLAVIALFAEGTTTIRNIYNWRVKETDRLTAMATELRKLGAEVEEGENFLRITPPPRLKSASINTYDDHRIAMSFSLAALGKVDVLIKDKECTAKTFPDYFERLGELVV